MEPFAAGSPNFTYNSWMLEGPTSSTCVKNESIRWKMVLQVFYTNWRQQKDVEMINVFLEDKAELLQ